jgi:tripartite-type tricarboxylate transporter receptor subunit TctC
MNPGCRATSRSDGSASWRPPARRAIVAALEDTAVRDQILVLGAEPMPGTPEEFSRFIQSEYEKWANVVAQSGAKQK